MRALQLLALVLFSTSLVSAATVTVRSGNGSAGGTDHAITFLAGPATSDFPRVLSSVDFSNAQIGPSASILSGLGVIWLASLSEDPSARWIGTNPNAHSVSGNGATALYAASFAIRQAFSSATLTIHYAVDDNLGGINAGGSNAGVYMNGVAVCPSAVPVGTF